ncbi:hypothetical protein [Acidovorax sp. CCYZU-2555]|uniref:hypothetical protein n=1 Tax=Acidovorax sp. CCYZU-2555 TaxID=2835042 RepID=UPI001BCCA4CC|nr:hypothetical protein [Acidovorax sp. CCYZU-2555]MBS7776995.1 hypothetical protein [Acidovorax sp. CCYZU-2555]
MKKSLFLLTLLSAFVAPATATVVIQRNPTVPTPNLAPGLYVHVIDGLISVSNKAGTANFAPGQFGYTPSAIQAPVVLPNNPGLAFSPPVSFNAPLPASTASSASKSNTVDCEVR